jgi:hypothetical protein
MFFKITIHSEEKQHPELVKRALSTSLPLGQFSTSRTIEIFLSVILGLHDIDSVLASLLKWEYQLVLKR